MLKTHGLYIETLTLITKTLTGTKSKFKFMGEPSEILKLKQVLDKEGGGWSFMALRKYFIAYLFFLANTILSA